MKKIFGKNWRTTLTGLVAAGGYAALNAASGGVWALKDLAIIAGLAMLGKVAKDAGVSGTEN